MRKGQPEVCDGIDNDCNGLVDDGNAPLGATHPAYAATLVDQSYPQSLDQGARGTIWVEFRNDGTETWPIDGVWLGAEGATGGGPSTLAAPDSWPAWDTAATNPHAVQPGETARFTFDVIASKPGHVTETFRLKLPNGTPMMCPDTAITPSIFVVGTSDDGGDAVDGGVTGPGEGPSGCTIATPGAPAGDRARSSAALLLLGLLFWRKRAARGAS